VLDGISLDQLRTFLAAVDEGSFSAAARRLSRAQSAVSDLIANLEGQLGVALFDRSGRYPRLTQQGQVLLADARAVVGSVDGLKARAKGMAAGLEPELSAVIDVFFPIEALTEAAKEFRERFPRTPLRLYVEALGGAYQPVLDGRASLGVVAELPIQPASLASEKLPAVPFVMVAAPEHPLAALRGTIPRREVARHVQLVITDRTELTQGREFGVLSAETWRFADVFAKRAFLLKGLGWGGMPLHLVADDIANGRLFTLAVENVPSDGLALPMSAVYPASSPPGPAGRWLIERLKQCPASAQSLVALEAGRQCRSG
jgi:DNA-binding transcriptional LysR family regulator